MRSAVSVNADATRIAFSVNEPNSDTDSTRVDRTLVADLATLNATRLEGVTDRVFMGSELLVRNVDRLLVLNANLDSQGDLGVTVADRFGSASPSSDGRHLAMLGGGNTAGVYVHVVPFTPNTAVAVTDAQAVESTANVRVAGTGRIAWIDA
jgi:hypothetical protein